jgi:hypothetical protein
LGGGFEVKEISKLREAISVLGYQLQNQGIYGICLAEHSSPLFLIETFVTLSNVHEVSV